MFNGEYKVYGFYFHIDDYVEPKGEWDSCPFCCLKPHVWAFDNGRYTACGCWNSKYDGFRIRAESIMSVYRRTDSTEEYDSDALRTNWNHWCKTGEVLFDTKNGQKGRW